MNHAPAARDLSEVISRNNKKRICTIENWVESRPYRGATLEN